jgi:DNA-binding CsgD family transcriptional regulator
MLVGYEGERAHLSRLIAGAGAGQGGALVVIGAAGAGKSSLCEEAMAQVASPAVSLCAKGIEQESPIPFAGLHQLLLPLLDCVADLPTPQTQSLEAALALRSAPPGDQLALGAAVHTLLVSACSPVVALIDDAHWIDHSTLGALRFAARRLSGTTVAMIFGERRHEPSAPGVITGVPTVHLAGLSAVAARELIASVDGTVSAEVADQLRAETGGNPLAIIEAVRALSPGALAGVEPLPRPLPVGPALQEYFGARIAQLSDAARKATVLAAAGPDAAEVLGGAMRSASVPWSALEEAEDAGLVEIARGRVRFAHPLVRAAAYHSQPAHQRREAHQLLAEADADPDRGAWHAARAAAGTDEVAAGRLRDAAHRALSRGGYPEAAAALQTAAQLSADRSFRLNVRLDATQAWHIAGMPDRALAAVDAAAGDVDSPTERARVHEARAAVELWLGNPRAARDLLSEEADRIDQADPIAAARLRLLASMPSTMIAEVETAHELAQAAWERLGANEDSGASTAALAGAKLLLGDYRAGLSLARRATDSYTALDPEHSDLLPAAFWVIQALRLTEHWDEAEKLANQLIGHGRSHGAPGLLALPLALLADVHAGVGRLQEALAEASEAVELCEELDHVTQHCHALAVLARVEAMLGDPTADEHANAALALAEQTGARSMEAYAHHAKGALALAEHRYDDATVELRRVQQITVDAAMVHPGVVPWQADLVDALVHNGETDDATTVADGLRDQAEVMQSPRAVGSALRCEGLLGGGGAERALARSLEVLPLQQSPFEGARAHLALGELLRRTRQKREARGHLRRAEATFTDLGATPWADRCRAELRAAGGRSEPSTHPTLRALTPQELRIALRVAAGETNREVAAALYLSPKTVENTLTNVYSKLGVRSRTELAGRVQATGNAH